MTQEEKSLLLQDLCARLPYRVVISCKILDFNIEESSKDSYPNHTRHPEYTGNGILFLVNCLANRVQIRPILTGLDYKEQVYFEQMCNRGYIAIENCKPYLRPMSSMTEEESAELSNIISEWFDKELFYLTEEPMIEYALSRINYSINPKLFDWLNKNMIDYRGLIPLGLAIEVTEENNPYKE